MQRQPAPARWRTISAKVVSNALWRRSYLLGYIELGYELGQQPPQLLSQFMKIAYYRVSTGDQNIEAQRHALEGPFDREFSDEGISGGTLAAERPGFGKLLEQIRSGDTLFVYAVDRLGRDALDVQSTVRRLIDAGITVHIHGLGPIGRGVGELVLAVLAQVADMERERIKERTHAGRVAARASLLATGVTHRGKTSLGRPKAQSASAVASWRKESGSSIKRTATHFKLSEATVKRYCAQVD